MAPPRDRQQSTQQPVSDATEHLEDLGSPSHRTEQQRWNSSCASLLRIASTYWCFILLGANDSSYGLELFYHLNYTTVSLLFLSPVAGFVISTLANHSIHNYLGQRGIALIGGACHVVAYAIASLHPPFSALVVVYILVGLGSGTKQAAWNSYVGGMQNPNELLGLLHGFYGAGATIMPSVASVLFSRRNWQWYEIYYPLAGMAALDMAFSLCTFATQNGRAYREKSGVERRVHSEPTSALTQGSPDGPTDASGFLVTIQRSRTFLCLRTKIVLLSSAYLLSYVGAEVALGGWMVTFLVKARNGTLFASGLASSGFWAGITIGRFALGFVTARLFKNVRLAVSCYLCLAMVMQLLFWLVPSFISAAITAAFLGFFLGPLFPGVIVCLTSLLPKSMQVPAIGICSAIGASGASIVPFIVGAIAGAKGVGVLQPIIFACLMICLLLWFCLPKLPSR